MDEAGAVFGDAAPAWRSTKRSRRRLVCVSGLDCAANEWAGVGSALARYGDVFAVELALRDLQSRRPLQAEGEAIARALADAPERSVLIGHSMGSVVSLLVTAAQPDRLAGLVLTAPFLLVARNGRSTLVTAADYERHRVLFAAGARGRRRQHIPHTVNRRAQVAGLRRARALQCATRNLPRNRRPSELPGAARSRKRRPLRPASLRPRRGRSSSRLATRPHHRRRSLPAPRQPRRLDHLSGSLAAAPSNQEPVEAQTRFYPLRFGFWVLG